MNRHVVMAISSIPEDPAKAPEVSLPPKLLDRAVSRLGLIALISAVATVAFYLADG